MEGVARRVSELRVRDGTRILLRPIAASDKGVLLDGFRRLSPESRYRRFLAPIEELSPEMLVELTELDGVDRFAWLAMAPDEPGSPGVGVARYVRAPDEPDVAEAAVTVVDDFHNRGIGTMLLQALGAVALENGIRRFRGYALESNTPIRELLESIGADVAHDSPGTLRVEIDLPKQAEGLRESPMYEILRSVARGGGPRFKPPGERLV